MERKRKQEFIMKKYTVREVMDMLGVSRNAVVEMINRHDIGSIMIGKRMFVLKEQYDEYIERAIRPPRVTEKMH